MNDITVKDYIESIRKNGRPQIRSDYFEFGVMGIEKACAVGQARLNLKLNDAANGKPTELREKYYQTYLGIIIEREAIEANDNLKLSFEEIANHLELRHANELSEPVYSVLFRYRND